VVKLRNFLATLSVTLILAFLGAGPMFADVAWTYQAYVQAMAATGRDVGSLDAKGFQAVEDRKQKVLSQIQAMLEKSFGKADPLVMKAFRQVPREYFMYDYETGRNLAASGYEWPAREWKIGYGSVLTDYIMQAYMTALARPQPSDVSLEVGTGSGMQSAVLSRIVKHAYTIEIITALGERVRDIYGPLGYPNVSTRVGDGTFGWPEVQGGFDIILVTAQAPFVPPALLRQLKPGGRLIVPIGQPWKPQYLYVYTKDAQGKVHSRRDVLTLFIPMTGDIQTPPPRPGRG
jgi:protein-L-isoaspartate(D-aspartate) O-methyltransferase